MDSPEKLKCEIYQQCKELVPLPQTMELGFFQHSKKRWINNRLDVNDMWEMKLMEEKWCWQLWCIGIGEKQKRSHDGDLEQEPARKLVKPTDTSVDSLKSLTKDYESQLKAKHSDAFTPFQYKLWAEMYAKGAHRTTP